MKLMGGEVSTAEREATVSEKMSMSERVLRQLDTQWSKETVSDRATNLIWVDVETTGLDPRHDKLLEVGCVVTDADLREVAAASWVLHWKAADLLSMTDEVSGWHERSGLLREVADSTTTLTTLTDDALSFLRRHSEENASPICGSTVGFDRAWLQVG